MSAAVTPIYIPELAFLDYYKSDHAYVVGYVILF
jgi:hypothetical protein